MAPGSRATGSARTPRACCPAATRAGGWTSSRAACRSAARAREKATSSPTTGRRRPGQASDRRRRRQHDPRQLHPRQRRPRDRPGAGRRRTATTKATRIRGQRPAELSGPLDTDGDRSGDPGGRAAHPGRSALRALDDLRPRFLFQRRLRAVPEGLPGGPDVSRLGRGHDGRHRRGPVDVTVPLGFPASGSA